MSVFTRPQTHPISSLCQMPITAYFFVTLCLDCKTRQFSSSASSSKPSSSSSLSSKENGLTNGHSSSSPLSITGQSRSHCCHPPLPCLSWLPRFSPALLSLSARWRPAMQIVWAWAQVGSCSLPRGWLGGRGLGRGRVRISTCAIRDIWPGAFSVYTTVLADRVRGIVVLCCKDNTSQLIGH